jgi:hypothetical protein
VKALKREIQSLKKDLKTAKTDKTDKTAKTRKTSPAKVKPAVKRKPEAKTTS